MVKACVKIMGRRCFGIVRHTTKAMLQPPIISAYTTTTVKAYAKTIALPKNGLARPVIWGIKKAVMNIADSMAWVINPIY